MFLQPPLNFVVRGAGCDERLEFVFVDTRFLEEHLVQGAAELVIALPPDKRRPAFVQATRRSFEASDPLARMTWFLLPQILRERL